MTPVSLEAQKKERPRDARAAFARLESTVAGVIHGKPVAVRLALVALAASQMDRFLLRIRMGYPSPEDERRVVTSNSGDPVDDVEPVVDAADVEAVQAAAEQIKVDDSLLDYAQRVVTETRSSPFLAL